MRVQTIFTIEPPDLARVMDIESGCSLVGGVDLPEGEQVPFRRIRGNAFSPEDVEAALSVIRSQLDRPVPEAFGDPHLQETFSGGVKFYRLLALRLATSFADAVVEAWEEADRRPNGLSV